MQPLRLLWVLAAAACLPPLAVAQPSGGGEATVLSGPEAEAAGGDHTVELTGIQFSPRRLKVEPGQTIRFMNHDPFEHDVYLVDAANPNDVIVPRTTMASNAAVAVTLRQKGVFKLYCTIHGGMTGRITTTGSFELTERQKQRAAAARSLPPVVREGEALFWGAGRCHKCHRIGERGEALRGPNLQDIGFRAGARAEELGLGSATEYIVDALMRPSAYIVEGYSDDMPRVYQEPIGLDADQLGAIVAYLQSQGGQVDTWAIDIDAERLRQPVPPNPFPEGDPSRGKTVFMTSGCMACHKVGDQPVGGIGPDLSDIAAVRHWVWLAESVMDPDAEIGANWRQATVERRDGQKLTGVLREQSADQITLSIGPGQDQRIPRDQIVALRVSDRSTMLPTYMQTMTLQQMADLLAYLGTLRGSDGAAGGSSPAAGGG